MAETAVDQKQDKADSPTVGQDCAPGDAQQRARSADGAGDAQQRDAQRMRGADGTAIPAPPKPGKPQKKDPNMFYPETYDQFDPECVVSDGEPQMSRAGGGKMLFLKYAFRERAVTVPLCVQAPKLFMPAGIMEYAGDGAGKVNTNALCSMGREWEMNPNMVAFKALCEKIQAACIRLLVAKQMGLPYCQKPEDVEKSLAPLISTSEKASEEEPTKLIVYPPSFKLVINTAPNNRTLLVTKAGNADGTVSFEEISHHSVVKGSSITPMVHFRWIYRRKRSNPNGWAFNLHVSAYQAVVEPPSQAMAGGASADKLAVIS